MNNSTKNNTSSSDEKRDEILRLVGKITTTANSSIPEAITIGKQAIADAEAIGFEEGKVQAALELANIYIPRMVDVAEGEKYIQIIKESLEKKPDKNIRVPLMLVEGVSQAMRSEYIEALKTFREVEEMLDGESGEQFLPTLYARIGHVYSFLYQFDEALEYTYKAMRIYTKLNSTCGMAHSHNNIALIYQSLLDYDKCIEHLNIALDLYSKAGDRQGMSRAHGNLLMSYCNTGEYEKSLSHGAIALEYAKSDEDERQVSLILSNIGETYKRSGNFDEAMGYFRESMELSQKLKVEVEYAVAANNLGDCYSLKKEYSKMEECLDLSLPILKKYNLLQLLKNNYYMRAEACHDSGKDYEAYEYLTEYMETNNKILTEETAKKTAELKTKFEVERMEQENEIYRLKNVELAEANQKLQEALDNIEVLSGLVPICSHCKKIRDDKGFWNHLETYISKHSKATFSHGICPECMAKLYPDFVKGVMKSKQENEQTNRAAN